MLEGAPSINTDLSSKGIGDGYAVDAATPSPETDGKPIGTDGKPIGTDGRSIDARTEGIISLFEASDTITTSDVARTIGLGMDRSKALVRELVKQGLLVKHGNGRYTHYTLAR